MGYDSVAKAIIDRLKEGGAFKEPDRKFPLLVCPRCGHEGYYGDTKDGNFSYEGKSFTGLRKNRCQCGKVFKSRESE